MIDLKIAGGEIVDGTGSPGYFGTVLVEGDTLSIHRGDHSQIEAARTIDATGHVVCPGFIDVHSHGGLTMLRAPRHEPRVRQGVTTHAGRCAHRAETKMAGVVVDTDVLSYLLRSDTRAHRYRRHLAQRLLSISFMTRAELLLGARLRQWGRDRRERMEMHLKAYVEHPHEGGSVRSKNRMAFPAITLATSMSE